jgi:MFS family permease
MTTFESTAGATDAHRTDRLDRWTRVLCVLFFCSGFPALIYQLTWQRALFRIFGVNIESVTIVVTAFMLGLGLGSLAGGWLSKRRGIPLLPLLAAIELMTGAFGVLSLEIFDRVGEFTIGLPLTAMAAVSLALVIVPTLLMGATLPVLVAHLVRRSGQGGHVGSAVALLYYVNTLGAGAACLACVAILFPFAGMQGAIYVAAAINAAVAAGALIAYGRDRHDRTIASRNPVPAAPRESLLRVVLVLLLVGFCCFVSFSYELFFFRTVAYLDGSSATAFALTLAAFLIGLASGSRQAGDTCALPRERVVRRAIGALMAASLLAFCSCRSSTIWLAWRRRCRGGCAGLFCRPLLGTLCRTRRNSASPPMAMPACARRCFTLPRPRRLRRFDPHGICVDGSSQLDRTRLAPGGGELRLRRSIGGRVALAAFGKAPAGWPGGGTCRAGGGRDPAIVGQHTRSAAMERRAAGRAARSHRGKSQRHHYRGRGWRRLRQRHV